MWTVAAESLGGGRIRRIAIRCDGGPLSYADAVGLWKRDPAFRTFFIAQLGEAPYAAYLWECPAVADATVARDFEFVLVDSPQLARMPPDEQAFASHFESAAAGEGIATFWNLGRDALLVAPCPRAEPPVYASLAAFTRAAPPEQQHALWRAVGAAVEHRLGSAPIWLSTSGLGVAWLHVRLDSRPKYYSFAPYRSG